MREGVRLVVVATGNPGKLVEIRSALDLPGWEFVTAGEIGCVPPDVVESEATFRGNALVKARAFRDVCACAALADDSGLEVDALEGEPGVRSARYAGEGATDGENNAKLLEALSDIPDGGRGARFRCVMVLVGEDEMMVAAEGTCEGRIGRAPQGTLGFGYDPLFWPDGAPGRTMAELPLAEKNLISHRGMALRALREELDVL